MPLGMEVGLGLRDIVLDGNPSPSPRCGQAAGWTKMPLGMEVGLGPGDVVFDGDPATSRKRNTHSHPIFGPCLLWPRSPISATAELL